MKAVSPAARSGARSSLFRRTALLIAVGTIGTVVITTVPGADAAGVVSGTVYRDSNNNGLRDTGEVGVPGVVVSSPAASTVTNSTGAWAMSLSGSVPVRIVTGWYRSQCNDITCAAGPGSGQDFAVDNQMIVTTVNAENSPVVDAGLVPDWSGGYPIPSARPVPANAVDVSSRVSFIAPTGAAGTSNCYRTTTASNRACAIGDQPKFLAQVFNEGTTAIANPSGYLELPTGTTFVSMTAATSPANNPAVGSVTLGALNTSTRRLPFTLNGSLPPGGAGMYTVTLQVAAGAPITTTLQTKGSYPNSVGIRVTSVAGDVEGDSCAATAATCAWGQTNKQLSPDNSDTVGFAIVAAPAGTTTTSSAPATTVPATTVPATTTTIPRTTVPSTTPVNTAPATTTTTTAPPGTTCKVSAILVPSCGAWLGASTAAKSGKLGSADYAIGLNEYEAVAQNTPDILHFYRSGASKFPSTAEINMANRAGKQRSILHYNWKPNTSQTWKQIAGGSADAAIDSVASGLKAYPHKVFLAIWHEPENDLGSASSGRSAADYVAMYRHVVTRLRAQGVTNAVFVMNFMGYLGWSNVEDSLYPGDDVVDWMAYDPYGFDEHTDFGKFVDTPKSPWPGFYSWATKKAPGKPIMMAEWGFDLAEAKNAPAILDGAVPIIQSKYPMLKALVYWNDDNGSFSVRLDQSSTLGQQYGQAYRRLAGNAYFNSTATASAP